MASHGDFALAQALQPGAVPVVAERERVRLRDNFDGADGLGLSVGCSE